MNAEVIRAHFAGLKDQVKRSAPKKTEIPFPVEVFPKVMQGIISATHECLKFPKDYTACSMLWTASVAIGNSYAIQVKEGWIAGGVLFLALVGRPGANKSHPLSFAIKPLISVEDENFHQYKQDCERYECYNNLSDDEKKDHGIDLGKPIPKRILVSDATAEAIGEIHNHNKRGIGLLMDELIGWIKNFNRYNNGSVLEMWLSIWSMKPLVLDRKMDGCKRISRTYIPVAGTIQTGLLNELAKDNKNLNGFLDRILFAFPETIKEPWSQKELSTNHAEKWERIIRDIILLECPMDEFGNPKPRIYTYSLSAREELFEWQTLNTKIINDLNNEALAGIYTKIEEYCVRFSLILQIIYNICGDHNDNGQISLQATTGAIKIAEYFRASATKVYDIMANTSPLDHHPASVKNFYAKLPDEFKTKLAVEMGAKLKFSERVVKRLLNDGNLFSRVMHGQYEKKW